jgi:hypothetical protein
MADLSLGAVGDELHLFPVGHPEGNPYDREVAVTEEVSVADDTRVGGKWMESAPVQAASFREAT